MFGQGGEGAGCSRVQQEKMMPDDFGIVVTKNMMGGHQTGP